MSQQFRKMKKQDRKIRQFKQMVKQFQEIDSDYIQEVYIQLSFNKNKKNKKKIEWLLNEYPEEFI